MTRNISHKYVEWTPVFYISNYTSLFLLFQLKMQILWLIDELQNKLGYIFTKLDNFKIFKHGI